VLILLTVVLLCASTVLLFVGFVQDHLSYVYLSMGCAALALVALVVFGRVSRRRAARSAAGGAAPAAPSPAASPASSPAPTGADAGETHPDQSNRPDPTDEAPGNAG
jgi:hypothetical protein